MNKSSKCPNAPVKGSLYVVFAIIFVVFPSQLALNIDWLKFINLGLLFFVLIGIIASLINNTIKFNRIPISVFIVLFVLNSFSLVSFYLNNWFDPVLSYGGFSLVLLISFFMSASVQNSGKFLENFVVGVGLSSFVMIVISFIDNSFTIYRYQGIFNNPNSMGWFANSSCSLIIATIFYLGHKMTRKKYVFLWIVFLLCFMCLIASNSRTALGAFFLSLLFAMVLTPCFKKIKTKRKDVYHRKKFFLLFMFVSALFALYIFGFFDNITNKFVSKIESGDITSGRLDAWSMIYHYWTWFGYGDYTLTINWMMEVCGAHNTFLNQVMKYGLIQAVLFYVLFVIIWFKAFKKSVDTGCEIAMILLTVFTSYLIHSMFEVGSRTPAVWISIFLFSILNLKNQDKKIM